MRLHASFSNAADSVIFGAARHRERSGSRLTLDSFRHVTEPLQTPREPLGTTLVRTITIALVAGLAASRPLGGPTRWPAATLVMLWPSLGGHFVEAWYLGWLRPRLRTSRRAQIVARLVTWFIGGIGLGVGMELTARATAGVPLSRGPAWWTAGIAFIGVELAAHLALLVRGRPSIYRDPYITPASTSSRGG